MSGCQRVHDPSESRPDRFQRSVGDIAFADGGVDDLGVTRGWGRMQGVPRNREQAVDIVRCCAISRLQVDPQTALELLLTLL